jgi:undecaprenyl diphosphate synthase
MNKNALLPNHIAFIPDGNGRWASRRGLARLSGHRAGVKAINALIRALHAKNIPFVTLYAFSTENWCRPETEVNGIFGILEEIIGKESAELHKNGIRIRHIGSLDKLSPGIQKSIRESVALTAANTGMTLTIALNYGGRDEILHAVRRMVADGVKSEAINDESFRRYLYAADLPDVDLVIRTGGEMRISNLLIWHTAYAEYYFTPVLWPDFDAAELDKALESYSLRQRRFGSLKQ